MEIHYYPDHQYYQKVRAYRDLLMIKLEDTNEDDSHAYILCTLYIDLLNTADLVRAINAGSIKQKKLRGIVRDFKNKQRFDKYVEWDQERMEHFEQICGKMGIFNKPFTAIFPPCCNFAFDNNLTFEEWDYFLQDHAKLEMLICNDFKNVVFDVISYKKDIENLVMNPCNKYDYFQLPSLEQIERDFDYLQNWLFKRDFNWDAIGDFDQPRH